MMDDDLRRIRSGRDAGANRRSRAAQFGSLAEQSAFVGRVVARPAVPAAAGRYFNVQPVSVFGDEVESGQATLQVDPSTDVLVYVVGPGVPRAGDDLICRFLGNRWVAEKPSGSSSGSGTIPLPGCPCSTTPASVQMISNNPAANFGMFQSSALAYGPTPPEFAELQLPPMIHMSPGTFYDALSGEGFRYYLGCDSQGYILRRLYPGSEAGTAYQDVIRYRWAFSSPGNLCSPFMLMNGKVYVGGDPQASVVITL